MNETLTRHNVAAQDAEFLKKKYPIAEIFTSPQGEGLYTGCAMTFIRLAGCSVGKKISVTDEGTRLKWAAREGGRADNGAGILLPLPVIPEYREVCTLYDGREFLCDTNFQTSTVETVEEILSKVPEGVERICITGGEPLDRYLTPLLRRAYIRMLDVHIETSGTVAIHKAYPEFQFSDLIGESVGGWIWVTVSPKFGVREDMLEVANEFKLLVDGNFDADKLPPIGKEKLVYIQPVNNEHTLRPENVQLCIELQKQHPHWRISIQGHKVLGVR